MPDPISVPNSLSSSYDPTQNMCVTPAPSTADGAQAIPLPAAAGSALSEATQQLVQQHEQKGCLIEDLAAAGACVRAATATIGTVPNLLVAAVNAFVGGVGCGVAAFQAAECHWKER